MSFCVEFYLMQTASSRLFIFMHPCTHLEVYLDSMLAGKLVWISYKQKERLNCQIISLKKENKNHMLHHIHAYERFGDSVVGKNVEGIKVGLSLVIV